MSKTIYGKREDIKEAVPEKREERLPIVDSANQTGPSRRSTHHAYIGATMMKIDVTTRALIPTRLVENAAQESSNRSLGRLRKHVSDIRVSVTDRRLRSGGVSCQVEIDVCDGTAVMARSVNSNPVEAVSDAFDKAARIIFRRLRQEWMRRRSAQFRQMDAIRSQAA